LQSKILALVNRGADNNGRTKTTQNKTSLAYGLRKYEEVARFHEILIYGVDNTGYHESADY